MTKMLSAADILSHTKPLMEKVEVPEWDGYVWVRGMTGAERDQWEASMNRQRKGRIEWAPHNARASICVKCIVDESGRRLFHDGQIDELGNLPAAGLTRIYIVASRLSGIGDEEAEGEIEEDFGKASGADGSSPSQTPSA